MNVLHLNKIDNKEYFLKIRKNFLDVKTDKMRQKTEFECVG